MTSTSEISLERLNPADLSSVIARYEEATPAEVATALDAVTAGGRRWSQLDPLDRATRVTDYLDRLESNASALADAVVLENGKPLAEAKGEVARALQVGRYQVELFAGLERDRAPKAETFSGSWWEERDPLGVVLLVVPWNFPVAVVLRKLIPALLGGNGVVIKPAEVTPLSAPLLIEAAAVDPGLHDAVRIVRGRGSVIGDLLVRSPQVNGISFTGSTAVGLGIQASIGVRDVPVQLEMGGKNATVVLRDADLTETARQLIQSAFTCSGQWCLATSRVIVERAVARELRSELLRAGESLVIGDGMDPRVTMGPVISAAQQREVGERQTHAIDRFDVETLGTMTSDPSRGYFLPPMIAFGVGREDPIANEEIFGPLLAVVEAEDLEEAIDINNSVEYGLASSIYTSDLAAARSFVKRAESGKVSVNLGTGFNDPSLPLGGRRESGRGLPENGRSGLDFFTKHKSVYVGQPNHT